MLVARRGGDVSAASVADLKGKRIAIVEGYSYGEAIDQSGAAFVRSRSEEDSLKLLLDSNVDYTLMDELVVQYILSNYAEEARTRLQIGSTPLIRRQLHLAVRRSVPDAAIDRHPIQRPASRHDLPTAPTTASCTWTGSRQTSTAMVAPSSCRRAIARALPNRSARTASSPQNRRPRRPAEDRGALSSWRQHLRRLDDRAGQVQGRRSEAAGSEQINRLHLPVRLVVGSEPRLASRCSAQLLGGDVRAPLAQDELLNLAGGRLWQFLHRGEAVGHLEVRDALPAERAERLG